MAGALFHCLTAEVVLAAVDFGLAAEEVLEAAAGVVVLTWVDVAADELTAEDVAAGALQAHIIKAVINIKEINQMRFIVTPIL